MPIIWTPNSALIPLSNPRPPTSSTTTTTIRPRSPFPLKLGIHCTATRHLLRCNHKVDTPAHACDDFCKYPDPCLEVEQARDDPKKACGKCVIRWMEVVTPTKKRFAL